MLTPYRYIAIVSPTYRLIRRLMLKYLYAGDRVGCPLCECTFRAWIFDTRHGTCPYCRSNARHRFLWLYLAEEWKEKQGSLKLLHFAPEWGFQRRLCRHSDLAKYITADLSAPDVDVHADIASMPFANETFDVVICSHVLEHIPDDRAAIQELARVLRPKGVAYIQVPFNTELLQTDEDHGITDPKEREQRFGQFDHVRMYGRDVGDRLREAAFEVTEVRASAILETMQMSRYGLWDDVIWRCERH